VHALEKKMGSDENKRSIVHLKSRKLLRLSDNILSDKLVNVKNYQSVINTRMGREKK
jgi:hypothetical protein